MTIAEQKEDDSKPSRVDFEWGNYEILCEQESTGKKTYEIYMRPPVITKTTGLTDNEWRKVSARLDDPKEWHPERVSLHEQIMAVMLERADALSRRLRECESKKDQGPTIYCLRGVCGSGKTTVLLSGEIEGVLDEDGQPSGVLASDLIKALLRNRKTLSHIQVHDEASMLSRRLGGILHERAMLEPYSVIYDKLMAYKTDFEDVFHDASETGRKVVIFDMDVPLELSAVRVLAREKGGKHSNIDFKGVADGFLAIRKNRSALFEQVMKNLGVVGSYVLKGFDYTVKHLNDVARLGDGEIQMVSGMEGLAEDAIKSSVKKIEMEISVVRDTLITEEYISYYKDKYLDGEPKWNDAGLIKELRNNIGKTISEALDDKSR